MTDASAPASRIPEFATVEEEAEFWDTHDLSDYWDEFTPATVRVSPTLASVHVVRLDAADHEELTHHADAQGTDPSTPARRWIRERLRAERAQSPAWP